MKIAYALVLIASMGLAGSALANEPVKSDGGNTEKFGRQIDDTVGCGGGGDKPGRTAEECSVKSGPSGKPGRTANSDN